MRMTIATVHRYAVKIPNAKIYNEAGDELEGLAIESRRLILISPIVEADRREEVLGHEVQHVWGFHVPQPRTEEERCQLSATIQQQLRMDLDEQGGIDALMSLPMMEVSLPYAPPGQRGNDNLPPIAMDRWDCGNCGAPTLCGSINSGEPVFHQQLSQYHIMRWFRCEICDALNTWHEVATSDGQPTGKLAQIPRPRVLHKAEASKWLEANTVAVE